MRTISNRICFTVFYCILARNLALAKGAINNTPVTTVVEFVTEAPTVTSYLDERQPSCGQTLGFCSNVLSTWTDASGPKITAGEVFAIEVQVLVDVPELQEPQYLAMAPPYVIFYNGANIPGWYFDDDDNIFFEGTGIRLGIATVDGPDGGKRKRNAKREAFDTIVAGAKHAGKGSKTYVKWAYGQPAAHLGDWDWPLSLMAVDESGNVPNLTYMGCYEEVPEYNATIWQLEAAFNPWEFFQTNTLTNLVPESCHPVSLLPKTGIITGSSATPTPEWSSLKIRVDFGNERKRDMSEYYLAEDDTGVWYIGETADPENIPTNFNYNMTRFLVSQETGHELIVKVSPSGGKDRVTINRFEVLGNGTVLPLVDNMVFPVWYIACPYNDGTTDYFFGAVYNPSAYLQQYPGCIEVFFVGDVNPAPTESTTVAPTESTTVASVTTLTGVEPNTSGCNSLDYSLAYSTTGITNVFATACFCWSWAATTIESTYTMDCTATLNFQFPSITVIPVGQYTPRAPPDFSAGRVVPDRRLLARSTPPPVTEVMPVPTPPGYASMTSTFIYGACSQFLNDHGISPLVLHTVTTEKTVVATTMIPVTKVQTVCIQELYISEISLTTSVIVVCPTA
ncbi:hypothetical protein H072_3394 [Dactylellina haptotyla CBS 200.50]|uniref:Uncharacterized protein n=1 Tax=Dactylellina haptotyla (strain CBS 200.50) TaxID=1284197 RepID=S8C4H7_DACHA|nr:hypothetical protein H072_3394 [Dactylellina haptotyla CBS 200.50]